MRVGCSLLLTAALSLIVPVISSSVLPRSQVCANDGKTQAGSLFERRSNLDSTASLHSRAKYIIPISWCSPGTKTWVTITVFNAYSRNSNEDVNVLSLLTDTLAMVHYALSTQGDGVIPTGALTFARYGVEWYSANANNHQQTWGVLAGAIMALSSFMDAYGAFGYAHFEIFDGGNQVGSGSVGPG